MAKPEGYRKALRIMEMAERLNLAIISFIDTPGAYPGVGAEQRGQSEAIGHNIMKMSGLKVPIISFVIGEGGSGGALAIGLANKVYMLQYSVYSVISPEGCSTILMKSPELAHVMAKSLKITAEELYKLKLIDGILQEPEGGAHRDPKKMAFSIKETIIKDLRSYKQLSANKILENRNDKFINFTHFSESQSSKKRDKNIETSNEL